jgi:hypothetical protein
MRKQLLILPTMLAALLSIGAAIYKWVDDKGVTHYSETPPLSQESQRLETPVTPRPAEAGKAAPPARSPQQLDEEFRQRHAARQKQLEEEARQRQQAAELAEIERGRRTPVPGATGAARALQRDVLRLLVLIDTAADPACARHRVTNTEWLETNRDTRTAVERWTLDRCGKSVGYRVTFTSAPQGGTNFSIRAE